MGVHLTRISNTHLFQQRLPSSSQSVAQLRLLFANPASRNTYVNFSAPEVLLYLSARFRIDVLQAKTLESEVSDL